MLIPLSLQELDLMRQSCQLAVRTLLLVGEQIKPGITTEDINKLVHDYTIENGGCPSPLHYKGFPKSVCTSRNDVACHGIPSKSEVLLDGDIINVDITTYFPKEKGFHGDTSATFYVGKPSEEAKILVETARECLAKAIAVVEPGNKISDIGDVIEEHAVSMGFSIARDFVGHGVGRVFHGPPAIPHYKNSKFDIVLMPGMIFTIEPIVNGGSPFCRIMPDCWAIKTADGSLSAQFEHTVLVTEHGCEVLTARNQILKNSEDLP